MQVRIRILYLLDYQTERVRLRAAGHSRTMELDGRTTLDRERNENHFVCRLWFYVHQSSHNWR